MKQFKFKTSYSLINLLCLLIVVVLLTFTDSCKKGFEQQKNSHSDNALVNHGINFSMLKDSYNKGINEISREKINDINSQVLSNIISSLNVDWSTYQLNIYNDSTKIIEFSVPDDTTLVVPNNSNISDSSIYHTKTSVVFILRQDTVNMSFFMKTIEDGSRQNYQSVISNVFYKRIPATFDGNIYYFTLAKQYINGYQWSSGVPIKTISITEASVSPPVKVNQAAHFVTSAVELTNCVTTTYGIYNVTVDSQGNILSWQNEIATIEITTCDETDTSGTGSSSGTGVSVTSSGGGGVAGDPSSTQPCTPAAPVATVDAIKGKLIIDVATGSGGTGGQTSSSPCETSSAVDANPVKPCALKFKNITSNWMAVAVVGYTFGIQDNVFGTKYITFNLQIGMPNSVSIQQAQAATAAAMLVAEAAIAQTHGVDFFLSSGAQATYSKEFASLMQTQLRDVLEIPVQVQNAITPGVPEVTYADNNCQ